MSRDFGEGGGGLVEVIIVQCETDRERDAARAKLDLPGVPESKLAAIASRNLERWLD